MEAVGLQRKVGSWGLAGCSVWLAGVLGTCLAGIGCSDLRKRRALDTGVEGVAKTHRGGKDGVLKRKGKNKEECIHKNKC